MTIDEAIETLKNDQRRNYREKEGNVYKAQALGIEALKRCKVLKNNDLYWAKRPLLGETEKKANATVIGSGYKPYINKDWHEPRTSYKPYIDKDDY